MIADLQRGKEAGELKSDTERELLNDAIFGAIYYRMLLRSGPLTSGSARNWLSKSSSGIARK
jgi:hypothetical protein